VNIMGNPEPDPGLGGGPEIAALDPHGEQLGKHKVMGLRNIALTPP
jgi:cytochrome c peroxidase